jgi:hypothetical protein
MAQALSVVMVGMENVRALRGNLAVVVVDIDRKCLSESVHWHGANATGQTFFASAEK